MANKGERVLVGIPTAGQLNKETIDFLRFTAGIPFGGKSRGRFFNGTSRRNIEKLGFNVSMKAFGAAGGWLDEAGILEGRYLKPGVIARSVAEGKLDFGFVPRKTAQLRGETVTVLTEISSDDSDIVLIANQNLDGLSATKQAFFSRIEAAG